MTLVIKPGVRLRQQLPADAEADAYIAAVEAADGQALEPEVKFAIKNFVLCCKQDGIWSAIKASCILAGARTLNGALVPLVGTAPTNFNFVAGDYNRETGLVGNGSSKYLNSNRAGNADPQDSFHISAFISAAANNNKVFINSGSFASGARGLAQFGGKPEFFQNTATAYSPNTSLVLTNVFMGASRSASAVAPARYNKITFINNANSVVASSNDYWIYRWNGAGVPAYSDASLSFYSIGESLDLARLDARVTDLINAIGAAIP